MQQLELFKSPVPTPLYKAGDWVKTKRKPAVAAWIKRGEIFRVNAVHPIDGSIQFWNPYINQWDFLYPDEVKTCPTPTDVETVVENVPAVETVVENVPAVETVVENLSTVETVVENVPAVETVVENLSTVESVVENLSTVESVVENVEASSSGWIDFHYKVRINGKQHSVRHHQDKCTGPYYTYRWLEGKKQRARYVPNKKMGKVYRAINMGQPTTEILKIISSPDKLKTILKK
ncbi:MULTISPECIES: hypothetical protein [unclassified Microcoleus]|uniref:hypothetical protein n=1 Tax=unclassified Microcoleus TaxID=2642155 RepID=UPI002FD1F350